MTDITLVLAHQGGWDEMLLVVVPVLAFVLLLRLANKRAEEKVHERDAGPLDPGDDTAP